MPADNSLSEAIATYAQAHFTNICGVQRVLMLLDGQDSIDFKDAMNNRSITNRAIRLALADRGVSVSVESLKRHRRQDCACDSER